MTTRCGFVALVGRPNVGKSTLLNHVLGTKLSITSRKPQTTRNNLLGIDTRDETQTIYVDTPGIHNAQGRAMNRYMVGQALSVLQDVDLIVLLVETAWTQGDDVVLSHVKTTGVPCVCAINKIDKLAEKEALLPAIDQIRTKHEFEEIVPISALKNSGLEILRDEIAKRLPDGPHHFGSDDVTDRGEQYLVSEIVREKLMRRLGAELPHRSAVQLERLVRKPHIIEVDAVIYVERKSQKGIVIGRGGDRLKSIGRDARRDIEILLGGKVMLRLWVKIKPGWSDSKTSMRILGYS